MRRYSDEELDLQGELYRANPCFAVAGIHFEAFLTAPARAWDRVWGADVDRIPPLEPMRPLLPAQVRAQMEADRSAITEMLRQRAEAGLAGLGTRVLPHRRSRATRLRDGRFVQPMWSNSRRVT